MSMFVFLPKAIGDTGCSGEQGDQDHHAGCDDHVPPLLLLSLLKLQVTELTALAHVAWYTTATGSTKTQVRVTLNASAWSLFLGINKGWPSWADIYINDKLSWSSTHATITIILFIIGLLNILLKYDWLQNCKPLNHGATVTPTACQCTQDESVRWHGKENFENTNVQYDLVSIFNKWILYLDTHLGKRQQTLFVYMSTEHKI